MCVCIYAGICKHKPACMSECVCSSHTHSYLVDIVLIFVNKLFKIFVENKARFINIIRA